jgi:hypothetical protein
MCPTTSSLVLVVGDSILRNNVSFLALQRLHHEIVSLLVLMESHGLATRTGIAHLILFRCRCCGVAIDFYVRKKM